ncbi:MAG: hypothetical protein QT02_C0004G0017 [archaeon GW2011_AR9]|nr:MAG: hypothetical protein QT02_C0004G0017 [archaeon GW2011_AR9]MBS3120415.1 hypothetical protein [Candidatus Woesearchaeota archaeon]HIG93827.1 hypothetical protein [Candidatus Woesearchaeota archaeon]HIH13416.1 hypothetical protein [Candidatus Woesearchaeota archaeon]
MKKIASGLVALTLALSSGLSPASAEKPIPCAPEAKVRYVAKNIPQKFKEVRPDTYLIDVVPSAKNGYTLSGQLAVFLPYLTKREGYSGDPNTMSIFDRTNINPAQWFNVSNWAEDSDIGCADVGVYLNRPNSNISSLPDSQAKFNAFVDRVYQLLQAKK